MNNDPGTILALDVGTVRIGVAVASLHTRLPKPLITLANDENLTQKLQQLIESEHITTIVVGLPRGLDGQDTSQTEYVRQFLKILQMTFTLPTVVQDEALSSLRARTELESRGKAYEKGDIDALAATFILEDYLLDTEATHV